MKPLILTTHYPPDATAASVRISQIVKRFSNKDSDIEAIRVVAFNPLYKYKKDATEQEKIEVIRYTGKILPAFVFMPQSLNPLTLIFWMYIIFKEVCTYKPDIILTTTPPFAPTIASYIVSKILGKPYVVDYRDDLTSVIDRIAETKPFFIRYPLNFANKFFSALLYHSLKRASLISTVNEVLQAKLCKLNGNVILVPNGIDVQELNEVKENLDRKKVLEKSNISFSGDTVLIVYVGDLNMPYYMPEIILEPLKKLLKNGYAVRYIIIGDGERKKAIEKTAKEMGMEDAVFLVGKKNHREVLELLLAGNAAFYSLQENDPQSRHAIGTKVFEYIGCGLPIFAVADEGSAISVLIKMYDIGVFVSWNELNKMEDALRELLRSKKYAQNIRLYYPDFINNFDRNRGMDLLYYNVKTMIQRF